MAGTNKMSEGYAMSFEAPAGGVTGAAVYGFHMNTEDEASGLARLLEAD